MGRVVDPGQDAAGQDAQPREPGRLQGRHRYRLPSGPTLLIDTVERTYHGPAALKLLRGDLQLKAAGRDVNENFIAVLRE